MFLWKGQEKEMNGEKLLNISGALFGIGTISFIRPDYLSFMIPDFVSTSFKAFR